MLISWFKDLSQKDISARRNRILLALTYAFYFGQLGVFLPYVGIFLDDRGLNSTEIGTLLAVVALCRIIGPNIWARYADRSGKVGEVLRIGCLLSFLSFLSILFVDGFVGMTLVFALMMMFWTAVLPQLEVITVHASQQSKGGYGAVRLWGSIGFIVCTLFVGLLLDFFAPMVIVYSAIFTLLCLFLSTLFIVSSVHTEAVSADEQRPSKAKIWTYGFIVFLLGNTLLQVSFGSFYNFFSLYMRDLDYSGIETGLFISVGVIAEVFIFIYAVSLIKQFGVKALLVFSLLFTALRWLMLALFADYSAVIVATQLIHALSFGLTHVASVYYLQQSFPKAFQSRAQALYVSIAFGAGGAAGSYIAGLTWNNGQGAATSFLFAAACALLATLLMLCLPSKQAESDEQNA